MSLTLRRCALIWGGELGGVTATNCWLPSDSGLTGFDLLGGSGTLNTPSWLFGCCCCCCGGVVAAAAVTGDVVVVAELGAGGCWGWGL